MSRRSVAIARKVAQFQRTHSNAGQSEAAAAVAPYRAAQIVRACPPKAERKK